MDDKELKLLTYRVKQRILDMAHDCGSSAHLGGSLSMVELLSVLYGNVMKYEPGNMKAITRDRFILSKGHCVLAFYSVLAEVGILGKDILNTFQQNGSLLSTHPVMNLELGIESSNGSLGQGLSMAVGIAKAGKVRKLDYNVYVMLGNGECNEGVVWEAAMTATQWHLDNLTVIVDNNKMQSDGNSKQIIDLDEMETKWKSFGFVVENIDGHDIEQILNAFATSHTDRPKIIIGNTKKGNGISFMENNPEWHHNRLTDLLYQQACTELEGLLC